MSHHDHDDKKPFWALMHPTENFIVWSYDGPIIGNTKEEVLDDIEIHVKIKNTNLLDGYVVRKVVLNYAD